jgi:SET domain-containing protein
MTVLTIQADEEISYDFNCLVEEFNEYLSQKEIIGTFTCLFQHLPRFQYPEERSR